MNMEYEIGIVKRPVFPITRLWCSGCQRWADELISLGDGRWRCARCAGDDPQARRDG